MNLCRHILFALCVGLVAAGNDVVSASTVTEDLTVAAAVDTRCSITTVTVDFASYSALTVNATVPLDTVGGLTLVCERGRVVRVRLGQGLYPAAGSSDNNPQRQMGMGTQRLRYNLYTDAARTLVWSNGPPGERPPGNTFPVVMPIYGRVPPGQIAQPGDYQDTVIATITF